MAVSLARLKVFHFWHIEIENWNWSPNTTTMTKSAL